MTVEEQLAEIAGKVGEIKGAVDGLRTRFEDRQDAIDKILGQVTDTFFVSRPGCDALSSSRITSRVSGLFLLSWAALASQWLLSLFREH